MKSKHFRLRINGVIQGENQKKAFKSVDVSSVVLYGAVLAAFWTFALGLYYWNLGWLFGASSFWIDMNLTNWSAYTFSTFLSVIWRSLINALGGALVYNFVAGIMGGVTLNLD